MARPGLRSLVAQARRSFWLVFGSIWLLAGSILVIVGIGMAWEERAWADAVRTTGTVLTKDIVRADADSGTRYLVGFRFPAADGRLVRGERQVDVEVWERLVERDELDVWYLPGAPEEARLSPEGEGIGILLFLLLGGAVAAIGGALVVRELRLLLWGQRLLRTGVETVANVTGTRPTNVSFNRRPQVRVTYSYRDARGAKHEGASGHLEREEAAAWPKGSRIAIRYDPDRPSASLWFGEAPAGDDPDIVDIDPPLADVRPPASP